MVLRAEWQRHGYAFCYLALLIPMAAKSLNRVEAIALTEKKVEMSLDEIIKMSKRTSFKGRKPMRAPIKNQGFTKGAFYHSRSSKVQNFLNSRVPIRQGVLAQRRSKMSNASGNQFPLTSESARRASMFPNRNQEVNWNKPRVSLPRSKAGKSQVALKQMQEKGGLKSRLTLDARFAGINEEKTRAMFQQTAAPSSKWNIPARHRAMKLQRQQRRGQSAAHVQRSLK